MLIQQLRRGMLPAALYCRTMVLALLVWYAVARMIGKAYLLPDPLAVATQSWTLLVSGKVLAAVAISARRLGTAFLLAAALGIPLGIGIGLSRVVAGLTDWMIEIIRPISGIAWIPVLLVVFGVGDALPITIIVIAAIFPLILNSASGVAHVDSRLINAATVLGASRWRILRTVILPAAVPDILTGARIAASNSWMALIVAELIGAPNGLGFAIGYAQELGNAKLVLAWILFVGLAGYVLDVALQSLQRKLTPWQVGLKVGG